MQKDLKKVSNTRLSISPTKIEDRSIVLEGEGMEVIIQPNIVDFWTRLEVLLGLKLCGHTDTLTESSKLINEIYNKVGVENERQY